MAKNYLIIRTTGTKAYSTQVKVYKIVKNVPTLIGKLHNQTTDTPVRYLYDVLKKKNPKLDAMELSTMHRNDEIIIHEIHV
jgi:hypothetical protein